MTSQHQCWSRLWHSTPYGRIFNGQVIHQCLWLLRKKLPNWLSLPPPLTPTLAWACCPHYWTPKSQSSSCCMDCWIHTCLFHLTLCSITLWSNLNTFIPFSGHQLHMYHKFQAIDAPFWAAVSLDIQHYLWAKMLQKFSGCKPSKTQFLDTYTEAVTRQMALPLTWRADKSHRFYNRFGNPWTLPVKIILNVSKHCESESTQGHKGGKFMLVLIPMVSTFSYKSHLLQLFMFSQFT